MCVDGLHLLWADGRSLFSAQPDAKAAQGEYRVRVSSYGAVVLVCLLVVINYLYKYPKNSLLACSFVARIPVYAF